MRTRSGKRRRVSIISDSLVTASLDRTQTSSAAGSMIVQAVANATASALGFKGDEIHLVSSKSHLHRMRVNKRTETVRLIKQDFHPQVPLAVHWDGKLLPSNEGINTFFLWRQLFNCYLYVLLKTVILNILVVDKNKLADRLPVLVTGQGIEQLLGVPELASGSGLNTAYAVAGLIKDWKLDSQVIAMVFDTTNQNSGRWNGACTLLQQQLGKELLHLACRHHIFELVIGAVFDSLMGTSNNPVLPFTDTLRKGWPKLDKGTCHFKEYIIC